MAKTAVLYGLPKLLSQTPESKVRANSNPDTISLGATAFILILLFSFPHPESTMASASCQ
jgi:hypothetical protein